MFLIHCLVNWFDFPAVFLHFGLVREMEQRNSGGWGLSCNRSALRRSDSQVKVCVSVLQEDVQGGCRCFKSIHSFLLSIQIRTFKCDTESRLSQSWSEDQKYLKTTPLVLLISGSTNNYPV